MSSRMKPLFLDTKGLDAAQLESFGAGLAEQQRAVNWMIGDVARASKRLLGEDNYSQVFPEWMSVGLVQRCEAVASAFPREEDRNTLATWSQHMNVANKPNRVALVEAMVGETSDESRKRLTEEGAGTPRWLLAIDVNYYLHRFWYSGAGVEAAVGVAQWVQRTVERLKEKGLTDVACCFDGPNNHRKLLTADWEDKYKDRPQKDQELVQQLQLVHELLAGRNFACVLQDGMEGDDVMASYAKQFDGRVTLLSQDKDMRQCLSDTCNILLDVEWTEDETTGDARPDYKWLTAKTHTEATGIRPDQWTEYQSIMGDNVDGVKGVIGIGEKGASDLIKEFGSVEEVIAAAKDDDERIRPKKREALIEFEGKLEVTRKLVTLRTDLPLPETTRV